MPDTNWTINWDSGGPPAGYTGVGHGGTTDSNAGYDVSKAALVGIGLSAVAVYAAEATIGGYAGAHVARRVDIPVWTGVVLGIIVVPVAINGALSLIRRVLG